MIQIRIANAYWSDQFHVGIFQQNLNTRNIAKPLDFVPYEPGQPVSEPTLSLEQDEAQFLFNELWKLGLRPKDGTGNSGHLAAVERHLADMKSIAVGALRKLGVQP